MSFFPLLAVKDRLSSLWCLCTRPLCCSEYIISVTGETCLQVTFDSQRVRLRPLPDCSAKNDEGLDCWLFKCLSVRDRAVSWISHFCPGTCSCFIGNSARMKNASSLPHGWNMQSVLWQLLCDNTLALNFRKYIHHNCVDCTEVVKLI